MIMRPLLSEVKMRPNTVDNYFKVLHSYPALSTHDTLGQNLLWLIYSGGK